MKEHEAGGVKEEKTAEQIFAEKEKSWGVGANFKFCEDAFLPADQYMTDSCEGKDYCSSFHFLPLPFETANQPR